MKHNTSFLYASLILVVAINSIIVAQTVYENNWVTNNTVFATVRSGNTIYIGGAFTMVGPPTGFGAAINLNTGDPNLDFDRVNGSILVALPDGADGWYIGGLFTKVGGVTRNNLARINADGTLNASWNPSATGDDPIVRTMVISDSIIYVGGGFTSVGGTTRNHIAAINATTGQVTSWNPNSNDDVLTIAVSDSVIYAGGIFTSIGGQSRNRIAELSATTGNATSWNPNSNGSVWTIETSGSTVYVGGGFTSIGGQSRNKIAALSATTGNATSWNPNSNGWIYTIVVSDSTVYAGGGFNSIGGQSRNKIAELSATTGNATSWNPNSDGAVRTIEISDSIVYVGGEFTSVGGQTRKHIAAINATTGNATSWNPKAGNAVLTLAHSDSIIYAGGLFTLVGGVERNHVAAINATTGEAISWNPNIGGEFEDTTGYGLLVNIIGGPEDEYIDPLDSAARFTTDRELSSPDIKSIVISDSTVYVGGRFNTVGGTTRNHIAAIDATTGMVTSWNPNSNGSVWTIETSGSTVYVGGGFTSIGGQTRNYIAAINATTGNATSWDPNSNSSVLAIAVSDSVIYAGGAFTSIGGQTRNYIAAINATTGNATSWNPSANEWVYSLGVSDSTIYTGGEFTSIGGQTRNYIAAINATTGNATSWDPNALGGGPPATIVHDLYVDVSGSIVYAAGSFAEIGNESRKSIAALDMESGKSTDWDPNPRYPTIPFPSEIYSIDVYDSRVYMGGFFTEVKNKVLSFFASVTADEVTVISTSIKRGWQLVSVPVVVEDYSADSIFPTVTSSIFAYVPGTGYVAKDTLDNGPGYWTQFGSDQTLVHTGSIIDTLSIGIESGWNIIGSISYDVIAADVCAEPSDIISAIYSYDNGYVLLGDGDFLEPGVGYWLNADSSGTVFLSESCGMQKITAFPQIDLAELDKFIVTDSYGKKQSLYVANIDIDTALVDFDRSMPPPMPVLGFDARFNYEEFIKAVSVDSGMVDLEIDIESNAYPVTLSWELNPENGIEYSFISDSLFGKISNISVENGEAKFNENSRGSIQLFGKVNESFKLIQIPDKFELIQNYPNPFNPTTTINYSIPKDGLVLLTVYNAIGERVAELVNEEVKAGYYEVIFDASRLSSGVYFYQIVAGKYMDAKKMILLK